MVRRAERKDAVKIVMMLAAWHDEAEYGKRWGLRFDEGAVLQTTLDVIDNQDLCALVAEGPDGLQGMASFAAMGSLTHPVDLLCLPIILYVAPESRGGATAVALLRQVEQWARTHGCKHILLDHLEHEEHQNGVFYGRLGYKPYQRRYLKEVIPDG
jgi:GNAT superfamily N-acetyltransferase